MSVETIWSRDDTTQWDMAPGCGNPDDFTAWRSEVRASAIVAGKLVSGSAYLGGIWEKCGDKAADSNPEISGYLPQMIEEALRELGRQTTDLALSNQIIAALAVI